MDKKVDYKKALTLKGNSVKRTLKEYLYYVKDTEKEQAKLKKMQEEGKEEGDVKRQSDYVNECEGAKNQSFKSMEKFYKELNELFNEIETNVDDIDLQKKKDEAKELEQYKTAKEVLENAKAVIEKDGADK